jgi:phospholipase/carboxylesterase
MGEDTDTPNLARIVSGVRARWRIDPQRLLLTGMSDGGTFCYVSGLETVSPFTHLAPVCATFHPMLLAMADPERLRGLPVYLAHGVLDWMFPVEVARQAQAALAAAGASVAYTEIDDLGHAYPREINAPMLAWLKE